jgi:uncharacterized repeat protein (TIGR01451 family)
MNRLSLYEIDLRAVCWVFVCLLFFSFESIGQSNRIDLQVKVQMATDTVRGGETLSYMITAGNIGSAKASNVILINDTIRAGEIVSGVPSIGNCELDGRRSEKLLRCELGEIEAGSSVTILVSAKIHDFGDVSETGKSPSSPFEINRKLVNEAAKPLQVEREASDREPDEALGTSLASIWLSADGGQEHNEENNRASILAKLLPSKNIPPRIKIISPKTDALIIRRARTPFKMTVEIEAFDPDGSIEKVVVRENSNTARPFVEDGQYKFHYEGKKYTAKGLEEFWAGNPPVERLAARTGKNTYAYTIADPDYGMNRLSVDAVDNGGRKQFSMVGFTVKGDATIEIISPTANQVVEPGSDLVVEVESKLNEGQVKELILLRPDSYSMNETDHARFQLVSKRGNIYRHRYVLKNVKEDSVTNIRAMLVEDSGAITGSESVGFLVRKRPKIRITSVSDGQVFEKPESITFNFESLDHSRDEQFKLYINGKYHADLYYGGGYIWHRPKPGTYTIEIAAIAFREIELARSEPIRIIVK